MPAAAHALGHGRHDCHPAAMRAHTIATHMSCSAPGGRRARARTNPAPPPPNTRFQNASRATPGHLLYLCGLLLCLISLPTFTTAAPSRTHAHPHALQQRAVAELSALIQSHHGHFHFTIDKPCNACERGAFATKAFAPGDVIASVPLAAGISIGEHSLHTSGTLYETLHLDPAFNATHATFWNLQPTPDQLLTLDTFTPHQIAMLQNPHLQQAITDYQDYKARLYHTHGGVSNTIYTNSNGRVIPTFDGYRHVGALLTTRSFHFVDPATQQMSVYLVPAIDMINHGTKTRNVLRKQNGAFVEIIAAERIVAGEQLRAEYDAGVVHRPDMSLLVYGFVPGDEEDLLLPASDLPGFDAASAFAPTPKTDSLNQLDRQEEIKRLQAIIAALPTSLQDDEEALNLMLEGRHPPGGEGWGWKEREIMKFRVRRKKALWTRLALLMMGFAGDGAAEM